MWQESNEQFTQRYKEWILFESQPSRVSDFQMGQKYSIVLPM